MHWWIGHDAEKRQFNASKTIPARKFNYSQEKWKELLVRPVARGGESKNEGNWTLLQDEQVGGGIDLEPDLEAYQRRGPEKDRHRRHLRNVRRGDLFTGLPAEMEGLNIDDRDQPNTSALSACVGRG